MCDGYPDCVGRLPGFTQVLGVDEFQGCPPDGMCTGCEVMQVYGGDHTTTESQVLCLILHIRASVTLLWC